MDIVNVYTFGPQCPHCGMSGLAKLIPQKYIDEGYYGKDKKWYFNQVYYTTQESDHIDTLCGGCNKSILREEIKKAAEDKINKRRGNHSGRVIGWAQKS